MVNPFAVVAIELPCSILLDAAFKEATRIREVLQLDVVCLHYGQAILHVGKDRIVCHNWPNCQGTREWKRKEIITHDWVET